MACCVRLAHFERANDPGVNRVREWQIEEWHDFDQRIEQSAASGECGDSV